jgi:hypothetical protein
MHAWIYVKLERVLKYICNVSHAGGEREPDSPRLHELKIILRRDEETFRVDCADEEVWTLAFLGAEPVALLLLWNNNKKKTKYVN